MKFFHSLIIFQLTTVTARLGAAVQVESRPPSNANNGPNLMPNWKPMTAAQIQQEQAQQRNIQQAVAQHQQMLGPYNAQMMRQSPFYPQNGYSAPVSTPYTMPNVPQQYGMQYNGMAANGQPVYSTTPVPVHGQQIRTGQQQQVPMNGQQQQVPMNGQQRPQQQPQMMMTGQWQAPRVNQQTLQQSMSQQTMQNMQSVMQQQYQYAMQYQQQIYWVFRNYWKGVSVLVQSYFAYYIIKYQCRTSTMNLSPVISIISKYIVSAIPATAPNLGEAARR